MPRTQDGPRTDGAIRDGGAGGAGAHHDRRHKSSNPTSKAGKKGAESIKKFQQRDAASISFDPIDRCTF